MSQLYLVIILLLIVYVVYTRYFNGLGNIPGPFIATISNLWKINAAWKGGMPQRNVALHRKYGPLVRIGSNMISVDDPAAVNVIYGFQPIYLKVSDKEGDISRYRLTNTPATLDGFLSHS
jgi:hypothetical protein